MVVLSGTVVAISGSVLVYLDSGMQPFAANTFVQVNSDVSELASLPFDAMVQRVDRATDHRGNAVNSMELVFPQQGAEYAAFCEGIRSLTPSILVCGRDSQVATALSREFTVTIVSSGTEAMTLLDRREFAVFFLDASLSPQDGQALLAACLRRFPGNRTVNVAFCMGDMPDLFQDFVNSDDVFYLAAQRVPNSQVTAIVRGAVARYRIRSKAEQQKLEARETASDQSRELLDFARQIVLQTDVNSAASLLGRVIASQIDCRESYCLIHNVEENTLWQNVPETGELREESAVAGLIGFVVRSGEPVVLETVGADPRYDAESDNPNGDSSDRLLVAPISGSGEVLAVLVLTRVSTAPPFQKGDLNHILVYGEHTAPVLSRFLLEHKIEDVVRDDGPQLFNPEAMAHHANNWLQKGSLVPGIPRWLLRTHRFLFAGIAASILFLMVANVTEFAEGPAVVRITNKSLVTASRAGTVFSVDVLPGQHVQEGEQIARLYDDTEVTELQHFKKEFELQLVRRLRDIGNDQEGERLATLRAQLELAETRLKQRAIHAPVEGFVELRVRPGQNLAPGDLVANLVTGDSQFELLAFLPGQYGPQLMPGSASYLSLQGFHTTKRLQLTRVSNDVVGPSEAMRYLGRETAGSIAITGAVVLAHFDIRDTSFIADERSYFYRDGMTGRIAVEIRKDPAIVALLPGLKSLFD